MTPDGFRAWRAHMQWTQAQAGEALGLAKSTIEKYESGANEVPKTVRLACLALVTIAADADYDGPRVKKGKLPKPKPGRPPTLAKKAAHG